VSRRGEQARGPGSEDVSAHDGEGACEHSLRNEFGCDALMRLDLGGEVMGHCSTGCSRMWAGHSLGIKKTQCANERATHSTHMSTGSHAAVGGDRAEFWVWPWTVCSC
jgi:hypothetical protein